MDSSRRRFLRKGGALAVNVITGGQAGLLRTVWAGSALPNVGVVVDSYNRHHADIAYMLQYAGDFGATLKSSLHHALNSPCEYFIADLDRCVQSLCFFSVDDNFNKRNWSEIVSDPVYLEGIALNSHGYFKEPDDVTHAIQTFKDFEFFRGVQIKDLYGIAAKLVFERLISPHADKIKGFDWVKYMKGLDSGDNIETVYQLLRNFDDLLPADILQELEQAYDSLSYCEKIEEIKISPLRQALMYLRTFDEKTVNQRWFIEQEKWTWRDYHGRYKVTADLTGEDGVCGLKVLQEEWRALYKGSTTFGEIYQELGTSVVSFIVTPDDRYEDEFDQMCSLSVLRQNSQLLMDVQRQASEDERIAAKNKRECGAGEEINFVHV